MNSFTYETHTLLEQQRRQLENCLGQSNCPTAYRPSRLSQFWARLVNAVIHQLTRGDEPCISYMTVGDIEVWKVYDPIDSSLHYFSDENEVHAWIEQHYYW